MKCPKCFSEMGSEAVFCPKCGAEVAQAKEQTIARKPPLKLAYMIAAALVVVTIAALMVAMAFRGKSVTDAGQPNVTGPSVTNAPTPGFGGPSVTNAPAPPPVSQPGTPTPTKEHVPPEVMDYLAFLKQIEASRQALLNDKAWAEAIAAGGITAEALKQFSGEAFGDGNQGPSTSDKIVAYIQKWQDLLAMFDQKPAPAPCAALASSYRSTLTSEITGMNQVSMALATMQSGDMEKMQQAVNQLQTALPQMQAGINQATDDAKAKLDELCKAYKIDKPFEIRKETEVPGSILGR